MSEVDAILTNVDFVTHISARSGGPVDAAKLRLAWDELSGNQQLVLLGLYPPAGQPRLTHRQLAATTGYVLSYIGKYRSSAISALILWMATGLYGLDVNVIFPLLDAAKGNVDPTTLPLYINKAAERMPPGYFAQLEDWCQANGYPPLAQHLSDPNLKRLQLFSPPAPANA